MRGSIVKRPGKGRGRGGSSALYYIVYVVGGKQKWEAVPPPRTRKHAEQLLAEKLAQLHRGEYQELKDVTFQEFQDLWMRNYANHEVRPSTLALYRGFFRNHLLPAFGGLSLKSIGVEEVQRYKAAKLSSELSPQSVKHHLRLLRQMLNHAIDWGYLRTNPATKVRHPRVPRKEMDCLSPKEVRLLLENVEGRWTPLLLVAISGGLRIGEVLAMKWANLDWQKNQYFVRETWTRPREGRPAGLAEPKTESSMAPVDLMPQCLDSLREHRKAQIEERVRAGGKYQDSDLVFATKTGGLLDDVNVVHRVFHPALKAAGLRRIRFHDLRHTCASLLIHQGESPKYIQKQMRHASIQITFDRYGHLFPDVRREAAMRMGDLLFAPQAMPKVGAPRGAQGSKASAA